MQVIASHSPSHVPGTAVDSLLLFALLNSLFSVGRVSFPATRYLCRTWSGPGQTAPLDQTFEVSIVFQGWCLQEESSGPVWEEATSGWSIPRCVDPRQLSCVSGTTCTRFSTFLDPMNVRLSNSPGHQTCQEPTSMHIRSNGATAPS